MNQEELCIIFSNRLYEFCLLKDIKQTELIDIFSKYFDRKWLEDCFNGKAVPSDVLLTGLSRYFKTSVDAFFILGERVIEKSKIQAEFKKRKIEHLENILNTKIEYNNENYENILQIYVKKALDSELISISKAASILEISINDIRKLV